MYVNTYRYIQTWNFTSSLVLVLSRDMTRIYAPRHLSRHLDVPTHIKLRHDSKIQTHTQLTLQLKSVHYGVATISRLLTIIGLFCKRALQKRLYPAKETYNFKEPTNRGHPIVKNRDMTQLRHDSCRLIHKIWDMTHVFPYITFETWCIQMGWLQLIGSMKW